MIRELIIDSFAGGGGASTGIEAALGRPIDIAINHDPEALAMHEANHPGTRHYCESVWDVDPHAATQGRPVGLFWLSPDCKHFSKAKGGKPVEKQIRGLAWVALRWASTVKPRIIMLENVEEFVTWGPLGADGRPCPKRRGKTFTAFVNALRRQGYAVDKRELRACDYGAPTIRKRLFLIARRDGLPIVWPRPTHGDPGSDAVKRGELLPWRTAAECIDWSIPCPSIFERKKPLAEATCRRIAKGIVRYVIDSAHPFVIPLTHHGADRAYDIQSPLHTVTAAHRGEMALVQPFIQRDFGKSIGGDIQSPLATITAGGGGHAAVVSTFLTEHANASSARNFNAAEPLRTQCAQVKGGHFALVSAFLAKHYSGVVGAPMSDPLHTVTAVDHHSLVAAQLVGCGGRAGQSRPRDAGEPMQTITAKGDTCIVTSHLAKLRGTNVGQSADDPLHTISAQGMHHAEVRAFLVKYYGNEREGIALRDPLHTVTSRDRFGLVTISGEQYAIADIGLRMLTPRELFRAQGFPESYVIGDNPAQGLSLTKSAQVRMCGNSVCPPIAQALVAANFAAAEERIVA